MGKVDSTHQNNKVYFSQGGDRLAIDDDGLLEFYGEHTLRGDDAKIWMIANNDRVIIAGSNGALSTVNFPSAGLLFVSLSAGGSNASAWLPSCYAGARLRIICRRNGMAAESIGSVFVSLSGCSLVGLDYQDLSSISLHYSDGSAAFIEFVSYTDNEWTVVQKNLDDKFVEHASS